jgi:hypothetical protein
MRTAVDPKPHRMILVDGFIRHFGPQRKGCRNASTQLQICATKYLQLYNAGKHPTMNLQHLDCGFTSNVDKLTLSFCQVSLPAIRPKDSNQHPIAYLASKEQ